MPSSTGVVPDTPAREPDDGTTNGSLTELAALEAARDEKRRLLEEAARAAVADLGPDADYPAGCTAADLPALMRRYYWSEPAAEVLGRQPRELAALALGHVTAAGTRPPGSALVDVLRDRCGVPVIRLATDDMPYLVDSVTAEVVRQGVDSRTSCTPCSWCAATSAAGSWPSATAPARGCGPDALAESWMAVVLDGPLDEEAVADLVTGLRTVLDDVRAVHEDGPRLRARLLDLAGELETRAGQAATAPGADPADDPAEAAALLRWLADGNVVLLGARDVDIATGEEAPGVRPVPGSGLGVLRSDTDQRGPSTPPEAAQVPGRHLVTVTKADARSSVHRRAWLDLVALTLPRGEGYRQHRFVGLFPSSAYTASVLDVPLVRRRVAEVIARSGVPADSHTGKELLEVLETYPRDELLQLGTDELLPVADAVLHLQERRQTRLFLRQDPTGRFWSAVVYLPRDRYTTEVRLAMQQLLLERLGGTSVEYTARSTESVLARLHFVVRLPVSRNGRPGQVAVDADALQTALAARARSWTDDLADALVARHGADGEPLFARVADAFPAAYQDDFPAERAVDDLTQLEDLAPGQLALRLWTPEGAGPGERRLTVYRVGERLLLSDVLPLLQHMGVSVVDERPYEIDRIGGARSWIYDFGVAVPAVDLPLVRSLPERFTDALGAVWRGDAEDDGLGALVLLAGLNWRQVGVVRAYVQWLRQAGLPFSQAYVESALAAHPDVVSRLVALFEARFSPRSTGDRDERQAVLTESLRRSIGEVESLDADRVLSSLLAAITATQRTTYYAMSAAPHPVLALKLDPASVPDLPEPRPAREVWVSSPRVMGIHLRFGAVARGGLRWSDRREDLRTEVLGLVKAQMVKNTVIVPTGAKGGFVVKRPPADPSREAQLAEGQACYKIFIGALLSLTDNLVDGAVVPAARVVRHDGDDTYLVVAADKGTATFSDLANSISVERGYWLGDAFASGGSVGYDHKAMGITARGAWESVTRHFRELDLDVAREDFTVVGVGDMSGDVFGNGMLLSEHIRLLAAFDHRHVFVDPSPDAASSFAERRRLFDLPRSSWADYDPALISAGGGVWPRTAKSVPVSGQMREALGLDEGVTALSPEELIRAILLAPADLLFNGGIGTYVKAAAESAADVGDKANDAVRVDGGRLRVRVVGEGGNLGLTQRGRIEYALAGGRVNTDAIDNSAGVDTSDHEVNIKIALNAVVARGALDAEHRAELLGEMTDEVAAAVLTDNHAQNVTLAAETASARSLLDAHQRFMRALERSGRLQRRGGGAARRPAAGRAPPRRPGADRSGALRAPGLRQARHRRRRAGLLAARRPGAGPAARRLLPAGAARALPRGRRRAPAAPRDRGDRAHQPGGQRRRGDRAVPAVGGERGATGDGGPGARRRTRGLRGRPDVGRRPAAGQPGARRRPGGAARGGDPAGRARYALAAAPAGRDRRAAPAAGRRDGPVRSRGRGRARRAARLAAGRRGRRVRRAGRAAGRGRGAGRAGRRDRRRPADAGRARPGRRRRADRGAGGAGRARAAVPVRAARPGAAAGAGHRAAPRPALAVHGAGVAARRPGPRAGLAHRGRARPAQPGRRGPARARRALGRRLGRGPGAGRRAARRHRHGRPAGAGRAAGGGPHPARAAPAPRGPPPAPPRLTTSRAV